MPTIAYKDWRPTGKSRVLIRQANEICTEYANQGYDLTLRQLYYQFVARGIIANRQSVYKRLGNVVNEARLAGLLDWNYITDRTRNVKAASTWDTPGDVIRAAAQSYNRDKWECQDNYVEVWVEKEALAGVVARAANQYDVPWFSCRGYVSQSEMWAAAMRFSAKHQQIHVLHLGDHDPSGIDMTRDIEERISYVFGVPFTLHRIALNMDQVRRYNPPPNPAKMTDTRFMSYMAEYGQESWELDALDPATLNGLIVDNLVPLIDLNAYDEVELEQERERALLSATSNRWDEVAEYIEGLD